MAPAIAVCASLTSVNVLSNKLDVESASMLLKVKAEKPNLRTLCGLTHEETKLDLSFKGLRPGDALLLAPEISVIASLTRLDVSLNHMDRGGNGVQLLRDAVRQREGFALIDDNND